MIRDKIQTRPKLFVYSKTLLSKRPKIGFQDQLSLNAGQKDCRMLPLEHSAILSTFIKLPFVIKFFVLSIFEWQFYTGFTVQEMTEPVLWQMVNSLMKCHRKLHFIRVCTVC